MAEDVKVGPLAVDPAKIASYGVAPESLEELRGALQKSVQALEQRYAQPNWFNVAAGFLKPQLGGFGASLGSAAQALGENVEQQKAIQIPLAQMRAQLAQADIALGQNKTVSDMLAKRRAQNLPITPEFVSEVVARAPESTVAKSLQAELGAQQKQQEISAAAQRNALTAMAEARAAGIEISPEMFRAAGMVVPGEIPPAVPGKPGIPAQVAPPQTVPVPGEPPGKPKVAFNIQGTTQEKLEILSRAFENEKDPAVRAGIVEQFNKVLKQKEPSAGEVQPAQQEPKKERTYIRSDVPSFSPLYTQKDVSEAGATNDKAINDIGALRFKALENAANPALFEENQEAIKAMIKTITSKPELARKVTNPLGQQGGILGGLMNVLEGGVGFNVQGVAGNIHIPVSAAIVGSYDPKTERPYFDQLMQQAAKISQIQQKLSNVNPSSIRNGEIEIYKNVSANPRAQGPDVMLYNLQYTKLNNEMLHEMYQRASSILNNKDPEYAVNPNSRRPMADIMLSPVMTDITKKYAPKFEKLNEQFLRTIK